MTDDEFMSGPAFQGAERSVAFVAKRHGLAIKGEIVGDFAAAVLLGFAFAGGMADDHVEFIKAAVAKHVREMGN